MPSDAVELSVTGPVNSTHGQISVSQKPAEERKLDESRKGLGLDDFRLLSKLGEGTFSEVLKVKNKFSGKISAMKRFRKHFQSMSEIEGLREIQALRRLNPHRHIIEMEDVIFEPKHGVLCLNFELMECNLYELICKKGLNINETRAKYYMYQICKGIDFIHSKGIFHRDIKPENILIKDNNIKIADLGSCRGIHSRQPYTEYIATRWYRSPEVLLCDGIYTSKMDIWAIGCVMYEMITKAPLFPGSNELDQIHRVHNVLGTPTQKVLEKIIGPKIPTKFQFTPKPGIGLASLLINVSQDCLNLCSALLTYSPDERISAADALKNPFFKDAHLIKITASSEHISTEAPKPIAKTITNGDGQTQKELSKKEKTILPPLPKIVDQKSEAPIAPGKSHQAASSVNNSLNINAADSEEILEEVSTVDPKPSNPGVKTSQVQQLSKDHLPSNTNASMSQPQPQEQAGTLASTEISPDSNVGQLQQRAVEIDLPGHSKQLVETELRNSIELQTKIVEEATQINHRNPSTLEPVVNVAVVNPALSSDNQQDQEQQQEQDAKGIINSVIDPSSNTTKADDLSSSTTIMTLTAKVDVAAVAATAVASLPPLKPLHSQNQLSLNLHQNSSTVSTMAAPSGGHSSSLVLEKKVPSKIMLQPLQQHTGDIQHDDDSSDEDDAIPADSSNVKHITSTSHPPQISSFPTIYNAANSSTIKSNFTSNSVTVNTTNPIKLEMPSLLGKPAQPVPQKQYQVGDDGTMRLLAVAPLAVQQQRQRQLQLQQQQRLQRQQQLQQQQQQQLQQRQYRLRPLRKRDNLELRMGKPALVKRKKSERSQDSLSNRSSSTASPPDIYWKKASLGGLGVYGKSQVDKLPSLKFASVKEINNKFVRAPGHLQSDCKQSTHSETLSKELVLLPSISQKARTYNLNNGSNNNAVPSSLPQIKLAGNNKNLRRA